jgi:phospholipase/lecithinase/hemolysin
MEKLTQDCVLNHATPYCLGYVFFNQKHPTTQTHQYVAEHIASILAMRKPVSLGQK